MWTRFNGIIINSMEIVTYSSNQHGLSFSVDLDIDQSDQDDEILVCIASRYIKSNGARSYNYYWNIIFDYQEDPYIWTLEDRYSCDELFCGGTVCFYATIMDEDREIICESSPYEIFLPNYFDIDSSYMITERPTQQSQWVCYKGVEDTEVGCCVACALASAKEIQEIRSDKGTIQNSVGWFYGATSEEGGSFTRYDTALDFLRDTGMMPYNYVQTSYVTAYPDCYFYDDITQNGVTYYGAKTLYKNNQDTAKTLPQKIKSWRKITGDYFSSFNWQDIFDAIQNTNGNNSSVVVVTLEIDKAFDDASDDGIVPDCYGDTRAGHMMIVLGWKIINSRWYFVCQNSWESSWGDDGLVYIPFTNIRIISQDGTFTRGIYDFYELVDDPDAPNLITVEPWDWNASNGDASAALTQKAYKAVTSQGKVSDFSYLVWNDLVNKVYETIEAAGSYWATNYATLADTKMTSSDKVLTAARFNSLRFNIGSHESTGITDVAKGDIIKGSYFTTLTDKLNTWISKLG